MSLKDLPALDAGLSLVMGSCAGIQLAERPAFYQQLGGQGASNMEISHGARGKLRALGFILSLICPYILRCAQMHLHPKVTQNDLLDLVSLFWMLQFRPGSFCRTRLDRCGCSCPSSSKVFECQRTAALLWMLQPTFFCAGILWQSLLGKGPTITDRCGRHRNHES